MGLLGPLLGDALPHEPQEFNQMDKNRGFLHDQTIHIPQQETDRMPQSGMDNSGRLGDEGTRPADWLPTLQNQSHWRSTSAGIHMINGVMVPGSQKTRCHWLAL